MLGKHTYNDIYQSHTVNRSWVQDENGDIFLSGSTMKQHKATMKWVYPSILLMALGLVMTLQVSWSTALSDGAAVGSSSSRKFSSRGLKMWEYATPNTPINASLPLDLSLPFTTGNALPMDVLGHTGPEFSPDQIHVTMWTETSMLFSWATGLGRVGQWSNPPKAYNKDQVASYVHYGTSEYAMDSKVGSSKTDGKSVERKVYTYKYPAIDGPLNGEGTVYQSPILHHVLVENLTPGQTYFYKVGSDKYGYSDVYNFTVPKREYPFTIGVTADLGQTANSSTTLDRLMAANPDVAILVGDLSYADAHWANGSYYFWNSVPGMSYFKSYQPRWDTFSRLLQKMAAYVPFNTVGGNHEIESLTLMDNVSYLSFNSRFPMPQYTDKINAEPDIAPLYWDQKLMPQEGKFLDPSISNKVVSNNSFHSYNAGPAHIVLINNYVPYGPGSVMYDWFENDLKSVDRSVTPWVIVGWHAPWYNTFTGSYKQIAEMQKFIEPLLKQYNVDLVVNGHVHAYERSTPVYQYYPNTCGPTHITIGDGGNAEGLTYFNGGYIDNTTSPENIKLCTNPQKNLYVPAYTPTYSGHGYINTSVPFCYTSQAPYSDFRDPSFGHGEIILLNDTAMQWKWNRNMDSMDQFFDDVIITKPRNGECTSLVVDGTMPAVHADAQPWV